MSFITYLTENDQTESNPRIKRRIRTIQEKYDECPHCKREIGEKELFLVDKSAEVWKHSISECGGLLRSSEEAEREAREFWSSFNDINEGPFGGRSDRDMAAKIALKALDQISKKYGVSMKDLMNTIHSKKKF